VGPGFWVDINSQIIICNGNQSTANIVVGVLSEISGNVTISNNNIWNDGLNPDGIGLWYGAGILISDSTYVSVYFNTVSNCMDGIAGIISSRGNAPDGQAYTLQNTNVNSNWITQGTGTTAGIGVEGNVGNSVCTGWNSHFRNNMFYLTNTSANSIYWMEQPMTMAAFRALAN
jgi:hypothetical protein